MGAGFRGFCTFAGRALHAYPPPRCTSPASSATAPPSVRTTRRPSPSMPAPTPAPPAHRTSWPSSASRARTASRHRSEPAASQTSSAPSSRLEPRLDRARLEAERPGAVARPRRAAPRRATATFTPIPTTAQPSCGRPSTRIPATLRPSTSTSLGHLIRASGPTRSATATPAASGSSRGGSRITTEHSSARPAGALHVRPWRPRPADCSAAVTTVPCGAPRSASSRARALVESVTAEVEPRLPEHRGHGHSDRIRSSSSTASSSRAAASPWFTATASRRSASS